MGVITSLAILTAIHTIPSNLYTPYLNLAELEEISSIEFLLDFSTYNGYSTGSWSFQYSLNGTDWNNVGSGSAASNQTYSFNPGNNSIQFRFDISYYRRCYFYLDNFEVVSKFYGDSEIIAQSLSTFSSGDLSLVNSTFSYIHTPSLSLSTTVASLEILVAPRIDMTWFVANNLLESEKSSILPTELR